MADLQHEEKIDLSTLEAGVEALQTATEANTVVLGEAKNEITAVKTATEANTVVLGEVKAEITAVKTATEANTVVLGEVKAEITAVKTATEANTVVLGEVKAEITAVKTATEANTAAVGEVKVATEAVKASVDATHGKLDDVNLELDAIHADMNTNATTNNTLLTNLFNAIAPANRLKIKQDIKEYGPGTHVINGPLRSYAIRNIGNTEYTWKPQGANVADTILPGEKIQAGNASDATEYDGFEIVVPAGGSVRLVAESLDPNWNLG